MAVLLRQASIWITGMPQRRILAGAVLVTVIVGLAVAAFPTTAPGMMNAARVRDMVAGLGMFGPLALIGLMVLAIVVSPVPSGPIAVAAGALYGTFWGGGFVVIGALLGACLAFCAARYLGFDAIRRSDNPVLKYIARPRSQFGLMLIVFGSRLVPFISFDAVSYAAGITCLSFGRFALATFLGVVPVCFALAAMGAGMADGKPDWMLAVSLGGAVTLAPIIATWAWDKVLAKKEPRK